MSATYEKREGRTGWKAKKPNRYAGQRAPQPAVHTPTKTAPPANRCLQATTSLEQLPPLSPVGGVERGTRCPDSEPRRSREEGKGWEGKEMPAPVLTAHLSLYESLSRETSPSDPPLSSSRKPSCLSDSDSDLPRPTNCP